MRAVLQAWMPAAVLLGVLFVVALVTVLVAALGARWSREAPPAVPPPPPVVLRAPVPRPITTRSRPRTRDSPPSTGGGANDLN